MIYAVAKKEQTCAVNNVDYVLKLWFRAPNFSALNAALRVRRKVEKKVGRGVLK